MSVPVSVQDGRSGQYRLILVTDSGQTVFENLLESDNTGVSTPITFASAPAANLVVESVTVPDGAVPGQTVAVTYVIRNTGTQPAAAPWSDRIYVDDDTTVSGAATLATVARTFDLAPGESYTVTRDVTLPTNLVDDQYHVMVRADVSGQVFEGGVEGDNDRASLALVLAHPDLLPEQVAHDGGALALSNSQLEVRWKVRNNGTGTTLAGWTDTVWLSLDGTVGSGDIKLGDLVATGPLGAGGIYEGVLTVTLPIDAQGAYKLIVRSDSGGEVVETSAGEANNTATDRPSGRPRALCRPRSERRHRTRADRPGPGARHRRLDRDQPRHRRRSSPRAGSTRSSSRATASTATATTSCSARSRTAAGLAWAKATMPAPT